MDKVIVIRYGEIMLKGANKRFFEDKLVRQIRHALGDLGKPKLSKEESWLNTKVKSVIENLEKRKIKAQYFDTKEAVIKAVLEETTDDQVVGIGGSMTIKELNLHEILKEEGKEIHWHWLVEPEKRSEVRQKAANADVYFTSTNALTEAGELVNIDGIGNRVSAMYYGPKKVIVICGTNKITTDIASAIERIKKEACPPLFDEEMKDLHTTPPWHIPWLPQPLF